MLATRHLAQPGERKGMGPGMVAGGKRNRHRKVRTAFTKHNNKGLEW